MLSHNDVARDARAVDIRAVLFDCILLILVVHALSSTRLTLSTLVGPIPRTPSGWVPCLIGVAFNAAWLGLVRLVGFLFSPTLINAATSNADVPHVATPAEPTTLLGVVLLLAIAPVVEELTFRGLLFVRWSELFGMRVALWASALLFAVLHEDVVGTALLALLLTTLYVRRGNLWVAMAAHAMNNAAVLMRFARFLSLPVPTGAGQKWQLISLLSPLPIGLVLMWMIFRFSLRQRGRESVPAR